MRQARQAARGQDAGDDLREALDPHPGVVRRRHAPARRRVDHADRRRDAARPRRDHRRHRARAVALCRRHHDPHPQPRCAAGAGRARHRARHQRADAALASLPGDGGPDDLRGASRPDRGPHRGLDRRRQQRAGVLGACRRALQVQAERRDPAAARAEQGDAGLDQGDAARRSCSATIRKRRCAAPIASSPTPGCRWATRTASTATIC